MVDSTIATDQSLAGPTVTVNESRFGPPLAVVAAARIVLVPPVRVAVTETVCQVSQLPVGLNARPAETSVPLTRMSIGRLVVVPLACRKVSVAVPAVAAFTGNST